MIRFRPLSLLMVLVTGAVFAADSSVSRTILSKRAATSTTVSSRSSDANAPRVKSRETSNDNKSSDKTISKVSSRNASSTRGTSGVTSRNVSSTRSASIGSTRASGEERGVSSARRDGVTARSKVSDTGRSVTVRGTNSRSSASVNNRAIESRAATKSASQESINEAKGILEQTAELNKSCQEQYNECMDQFCAVVDSNQNRCSCSANLANYSKVEEAVKAANTKLNEVAQDIRYIGLSADEIRAIMKETEAEQVLSGSRDSSKNRNMLEQIEQMIKNPKTSSASYSDDGFGLDINLDFSSNKLDILNLDFLNVKNSSNSLSNLRGAELYKAARNRCNTVLTQCKKSGANVNQITGNYDLSIDKDCIAYESGLKKMNETLISNANSAERMLQKARLTVMQNKNQYDIKGCVGALETCMKDDMVCGSDYEKCVDPTKRYIDENGEVVLGQNITSISEFMKNYNNAAINSDFLSRSYNTSINESCPNDGKCTVKYLLQKIGTKQKVTDEGLCRAVLDKCQQYTYSGKEYQPFNPVVVNYIQRAMVNIKASQSRIISEYASSCMVDVAACYNQQVTQVNSWTSSASVNSIYNIMNGACRSVALTCGLAVFLGDPNIENIPVTIDGTTYIAHSCQAASGKTGAALNSAIITCLSEMFYQSLLCPDNSTYTSTTGNVSANETLAGYVNTRCVCNTGYVVLNGACVTPCQTGEVRTSTGRCQTSSSDSDSSSGSSSDDINLNRYSVLYIYGSGSGETRTKVYGLNESVAIPVNSTTRTGYTADNTWSYNGDIYIGGTTVSALTTKAGDRIEMVAQWTPNTYTARYECPDGSYKEGVATFDAEYEIDETFKCPEVEGYTIGQYWRPNNASNVYSPGNTFIWRYAENITFVPTDGGAVQYTLTYTCGDGATGTAPAKQTITMNSAVALSATAGSCKKTGYSFDGWQIGDTKYDPNDEYRLNAAGDVTATAQWQAGKYTISFNVNGATTGAPDPASKACTYDQSCILAKQGTMAKDTDTFDGWNTKSNGTGKPYAAGASVILNANTTLYAVWSACTDCDDPENPGGGGDQPGDGEDSNTITTMAGYYLPKNSEKQVQCPAGSYCTGGVTCTKNSSTDCGITACSSYTIGRTSPEGGTFSTDNAGSTSSTMCKYLGPTKDLVGCYSATPGSVTNTGSSWPATPYTITAKAGYKIVNNNTANARCEMCPDNAIQPDNNSTATACTPCGDNQSANAERTSCSFSEAGCDEGQYLHENKCTECLAGYKCEGGDWVKDGEDHGIIICENYTYSGKGQSACSTVTSGYFARCPEGSNGKGCTTQQGCGEPDHYCTGARQYDVQTGYWATGCADSGINCTGQEICPAGSKCVNGVKIACNGASEYQDEAGKTECKVCPEGKKPNEVNTSCVYNEYKISFNLYGGKLDGNSEPETMKVRYGTEVTINHPVHDNGTFKGWEIQGLDSNIIHYIGGVEHNGYSVSSADPTKATKFKNLHSAEDGSVNFYAIWICNTGYEGSDCHLKGDIVCGSGRYLPAGGASSDDCIKCPAGSFCQGGTFAYNAERDQGITGQCQNYRYSLEGYSECATAGVGNYATGCDSNGNGCTGTSNCKSTTEYCTGGRKYNVQTGYWATGCNTSGYYCQGEEICPLGYKCVDGVKSLCDGDNNRLYQDTTGQTSCKTCTGGWEANEGHTGCKRIACYDCQIKVCLDNAGQDCDTEGNYRILYLRYDEETNEHKIYSSDSCSSYDEVNTVDLKSLRPEGYNHIVQYSNKYHQCTWLGPDTMYPTVDIIPYTPNVNNACYMCSAYGKTIGVTWSLCNGKTDPNCNRYTK